MSNRAARPTRRTSHRHEVQYFKIMGNRGIYYKGWSAVTKHRTPWLMAIRRASQGLIHAGFGAPIANRL
jgi:hypothetical protein